RNANSGYSATASFTCTNVTPHTAVTAIRTRSAGTKGAGYGVDRAHARHLRTSASRPSDLGHRPLQLPLRLPHAEGGLRPRPPLSRPAGAADVRGDRARRPCVRERRRAEAPHHGRRAAPPS